MKRSLVLVAMATLFLFGCGKDSGSNPNPVSDRYDSVQLVLFSAPWCLNCTDELKGIDQQLGTFPKSTRVSTVMYIISGDTSGQQPTQDLADKYKARLGVHFVAKPDPWRYQMYHKYISATGSQLPAAALLNPQGEVIKRFSPGTYGPNDVMAELKNRLK
jgi:hypothetical protein